MSADLYSKQLIWAHYVMGMKTYPNMTPPTMKSFPESLVQQKILRTFSSNDGGGGVIREINESI